MPRKLNVSGGHRPRTKAARPRVTHNRPESQGFLGADDRDRTGNVQLGNPWKTRFAMLQNAIKQGVSRCCGAPDRSVRAAEHVVVDPHQRLEQRRRQRATLVVPQRRETVVPSDTRRRAHEVARQPQRRRLRMRTHRGRLRAPHPRRRQPGTRRPQRVVHMPALRSARGEHAPTPDTAAGSPSLASPREAARTGSNRTPSTASGTTRSIPREPRSRSTLYWVTAPHPLASRPRSETCRACWESSTGPSIRPSTWPIRPMRPGVRSCPPRCAARAARNSSRPSSHPAPVARWRG